eukprot:569371-Rhodomonas_salina.1
MRFLVFDFALYNPEHHPGRSLSLSLLSPFQAHRLRETVRSSTPNGRSLDSKHSMHVQSAMQRRVSMLIPQKRVGRSLIASGEVRCRCARDTV